MKRISVILILLFCLASGFAQPAIKFSDSKKNFGMVKQGKVIQMEFSFTNTGNQPLIITETKVECSCTTVEKPDQPVPPGQNGIIKVEFNTQSVYDRQDRIVEIISNDPKSPAKIRFKGVVLRK
jgi:hypothetical protein